MLWHETLDQFADIVAAWEVLLYEVEGAGSSPLNRGSRAPAFHQALQSL